MFDNDNYNPMQAEALKIHLNSMYLNSIYNENSAEKTLKIDKNDNGFNTLDASIEADVYIVPNKPNDLVIYGRDAKDMSFVEIDLFYSNRSTNGFGTDNLSKAVHVCIVNSKFTDMTKHPFSVTTTDGKIFAGMLLDELPVELFEGKKEGDTVECKLLGEFVDNTETNLHNGADDNRYYLLPVKLHLNQLGYKYAKHGAFDELLAKLIEKENLHYFSQMLQY